MASKLRVYTTPGSPPSTAVVSTLMLLGLPFDEVSLDYMAGEHVSEEHDQRNPAKELPVLQDNEFFLSESVAIMQYLCDNYGGDVSAKLYPRESKQRALVNHRLAFNLSNFYSSVAEFAFSDCFGLPGDPMYRKNKCEKALTILETILTRQGTRFAIGDSMTIADIALVNSVITLDAITFDLSTFPVINQWYETMQTELPKQVWQVIKTCRHVLQQFCNNPPSQAELQKLEKMKKGNKN